MKLLNCPFCGSDEIFLVKGDSMAWVICLKCGADGPTALSTPGAIRKWNERIRMEDGDCN